MLNGWRDCLIKESLPFYESESTMLIKENTHKQLLFMDIDNTVIYSHRYKRENPVVWLEMLNGKKQSFMTQKTYQFFKEQNWLNVVPITTRTCTQYERINCFLQSLGWYDALICNGAILLHGYEAEKEWTKESLVLSQKDHKAFFYLLDVAKFKLHLDSIIEVPPFMFYIKTDQVEMVYKNLKQYADLSHLSIFKDKRKVYCIPISLDKGSAMRRYQKRIGNNYCMAAGDSLFDIPMLEKADVSFFPKVLQNVFDKSQGERVMCDGIFSNVLCEMLEKRKKFD